MLSPMFFRPKPLGLRIRALPQQYNGMDGPGTRLNSNPATSWINQWRISSSYWAVLFPGMYKIQAAGGGGGGGASNWYGWAGERGALGGLWADTRWLSQSSEVRVALGGSRSSEFNDWTAAAGGSTALMSIGNLASGGTAGRNAPPGPGTNPNYSYTPIPGHTMLDGAISGTGGQGSTQSNPANNNTGGVSGRLILELIG